VFVSLLTPSIFADTPARHLLVFYKQVADYGRDEIAFVGEPEYFCAPAALKAQGRWEWQPALQETYEFQPPANLDGVVFETLPPDLFETRLARTPNWKLYGQLMRRRLPELESAFASALDRLQARDRIEAVIAFADMPSLAQVARHRGLPFVHCEFGPLRKPAYAMTGYWDLRTVGASRDARRRFADFSREVSLEKPSLLERDELLYTLRRGAMPAIAPPESARFRVGLALQGDDNAYAQGIAPLDLYATARRHVGRADILIRHHSMALTRCTDQLGVIDDSPTSTDFILACETILTVSSGIALEAALLGRRVVVLGDSAFVLAADSSFERESRRRRAGHQLLALNFLVFGYLAPLDLVFDAEYTRWRLSRPSELEIFRYHQHWYRTRLAESPSTTLSKSIAAKLLQSNPGGAPRETVVVFGAGSGTTALLDRLRVRYDIACVFDNDASKWGARLGLVTVERPAYRERTTILVASQTHGDAMVEQLRAIGYSPDRIARVGLGTAA
jgi:hypothetical protein